MVWIPALLRQGVAVGVKDLERKARQRHHLPGGGVALHHLQPGCQGVVVRDVLQLGAVRHLLGADGPVSNVREARRHRGLDLVNGVAAGVVGKGAVHTGRAGARAKPKRAVGGGVRKAVGVGDELSHHAARGVADDLETHAARRLLQARPLLPVVLELCDLKVKGHDVLLEGGFHGYAGNAVLSNLGCRRLGLEDLLACLVSLRSPRLRHADPPQRKTVKAGPALGVGRGDVRAALGVDERELCPRKARARLGGSSRRGVHLLDAHLGGGGDVVETYDLPGLGLKLHPAAREQVAGGSPGLLGVVARAGPERAGGAPGRVGGDGCGQCVVAALADLVGGAGQAVGAVAKREAGVGGALLHRHLHLRRPSGHEGLGLVVGGGPDDGAPGLGASSAGGDVGCGLRPHLCHGIGDVGVDAGQLGLRPVVVVCLVGVGQGKPDHVLRGHHEVRGRESVLGLVRWAPAVAHDPVKRRVV